MKYITADQRKLAHAFIGDIADFLEDNKAMLIYEIKTAYKSIMDDEGFTLKSEESKANRRCTVDEFNDFMDYVFYIAYFVGFHSNKSPMVYFEDTERYLAMCIKYRLCAITLRPGADLHHWGNDKIGMGQDRRKVDHSKRKRIALSREKHQLAHMIGDEEFAKLYHVFGICVPYHNDVADSIDECEE